MNRPPQDLDDPVPSHGADARSTLIPPASVPRGVLTFATVLTALLNLGFGLCCCPVDLVGAQFAVQSSQPEGREALLREIDRIERAGSEHKNLGDRERTEVLTDAAREAIGAVDGPLAALTVSMLIFGKLMFFLSGALLLARVRAGRTLGMAASVVTLASLVVAGWLSAQRLESPESGPIILFVCLVLGVYPLVALILLAASPRIRASLGMD